MQEQPLPPSPAHKAAFIAFFFQAVPALASNTSKFPDSECWRLGKSKLKFHGNKSTYLATLYILHLIFLQVLPRCGPGRPCLGGSSSFGDAQQTTLSPTT